jgi:hypothetical protein
MVGRAAVAAVTAVAITVLLGATASAVTAYDKVGPNQIFGGLVNNHNGISTPAVIQMACFGPVRPGETGHPMAGQTVEVFRPEAIPGDFGNTGASATHIVTFFGPPPPEPATTTTTGTVTFWHYLVVKAIPTSLVLPCSGSGNVYFVPMPFSPPTSTSTASPARVPVSYVGQP